MSNYFWTIDAGHGGLTPAGDYTTPSKKGKQYTFEEDGLTVYEGVVNRQIARLLIHKLKSENIDYGRVYDPIEDKMLRDRVSEIDEIFHREKSEGRTSILLSIHSNAMTKPEEIKGDGQTVASYNSIWTSRGATLSDKLVQFFEKSYKENLPEWRFASEQSDGDADFEADFYILRKSDGPAILVENLFFDHRENAEFLLSEEGQIRIADTLYSAIRDIELIQPI